MQVSNDIDELFARKLGNMEVAPPDDGWSNIENELNHQSRMTRKFWLTAASLALVLSVTATVVYMQTDVTDNYGSTIATQEIRPQHSENQPSAPDDTYAVVQQQKNKPAVQDSENKAIVQNEKEERPMQNENTIVQNEASVPVAASASTYQPNISVYNDSWEGIRQMQPVKPKWKDIMSRKIARTKLELPAKKNEELLANVSSSATQQYDDFAGIDITALSTNPHPRKRWEITGAFAPMYSYRTLSTVPSGVRKSDFDEAESPLQVYSGGIAFSYQVFGRLSIQTGMFYSQMGQSINSVIPVTNMYAAVSSNNSYTKNFVRTSSGSVTIASNLKSDANVAYGSYFNTEAQPEVANNTVQATAVAAPAKYKLVERIDYMEIPLILRYSIINRKLNLYVLGGMSANILIDNNVLIDNGSEVVKGGTILMARPINYSSSFGLGLDYQLTGTLSIRLEPSFKYYLQSYTTGSQIGSNPYAFGLFTGIAFRF